jgi:hypothetical protein
LFEGKSVVIAFVGDGANSIDHDVASWAEALSGSVV